jgi:hypothetical protein
MYLEESNYKTGLETWHGMSIPRTTPSDFVCHPSNRGILCGDLQ